MPLRKRFPGDAVDKRLSAHVNPKVCAQITLLCKRHLGDGACEWLFTSVRMHVPHQVFFLDERRRTVAAFLRSVAVMLTHTCV